MEQTSRMPEATTLFLAAWLQAARFGLAGLLLVWAMRRRGLPTPLEWRQGMVIGFWGGLGMAIQADALAYTHASTSAFLTQGYCVILPLWAALRSRRAPTGRVMAATLLVMAGSAVLAGLRWDDFRIGRGEAGTMVAALFFAFQILTLEDRRYAENRGVPVTFVMCASIVLLFVPIALIAAPRPAAMLEAGASMESFTLVLVLSVFCSVGAFLLMNIWQRRVTATEAGLIYTMEPVFTAIYVLFLPSLLGTYVGQPYANESMTLTVVTGGALIVGANLLMRWKAAHRPAIAPVP